MASGNPFELLVDDDSEDPSQLISAKLKEIETKETVVSSAKAPQSQAKLPSKPLAPTQADRGARGGRGRWNGRGRGAGGVTRREYGNNGSSYGSREVSGGRGHSRGGHRGSYSNGYVNHDQSPRQSDRHNGTGGDFERRGGIGNWESQTDEPAKVAGEVVGEGETNLNLNAQKSGEGEKHLNLNAQKSGEGEKNLNLNAQKSASTKNGHATGNGRPPLTEEEAAKKRAEREEDAKKMTLAQYEKILEEKKKALQSTGQTDERRIEDKDFETMKKISNKKTNDEVFAKLASDKEKKKQKEERAKKSVMSINEFLKPAEGERYYVGGRDRRAQGGQSGANARGNGNEYIPKKSAPVYVEDPGQFPTLGGK